MKRNALQTLDDQLRTEARQIQEKNSFSPLLHARIMTALRRHQDTSVRTLDARRGFWRLAGPLATAAAIALAAWLILRPEPTENSPSFPIATNPPSMPQVTLNVNPTSTALEERKYAYLDRDVKKLFLFVADQLPNFPGEPTPK